MVTMTHPDETNKFDTFLCILGVLLQRTRKHKQRTMLRVISWKEGKCVFPFTFAFCSDSWTPCNWWFELCTLGLLLFWLFYLIAIRAHRWCTHMGTSSRVRCERWTLLTSECVKYRRKIGSKFSNNIGLFGIFFSIFSLLLGFVWKWGMRVFFSNETSQIFLCGINRWDFGGTINQIDV